MERIFSTRIKLKIDFFLPFTVLVIGLMVTQLVPQFHWIMVFGIAILVYYVRLANQPELFFFNEQIRINYPYIPIRQSLLYNLADLERVTYVDRKLAIPGSYPNSHINIYKKGCRVRFVKIILDPDEIEKVKEILISKGVEFKYTTKMEENYV